MRNIKTKRVLRPRFKKGYYSAYLYKNDKAKNHNIHRLVANAFIPQIDITKKYVDHVDNDKLNNTVSNLRWCSSRENSQNSMIRSDNTSGIKGVSWDSQKKKWHARIYLNNKCIHLGYFDTLEDAKIVRQQKSSELFGEFQNACEK